MYISFTFFLSLMICSHTRGIYNDLYSLWDYNTARNKIERSAALDEAQVNEFKHIMEQLGIRGPKMGVSNISCDDAKSNLIVDWDGSPINYTCYTPKDPLPVKEDIPSIKESDRIPHNYIPRHHCMTEAIMYTSNLPTHGDHRPLWPIFGEYHFVPPQRWLHNIEHGSVVMLYHPCTNKQLVDELRSLVKGCIRKHIITADSKMSKERPLALVSWGHRLLMNHIDRNEVISFIRKYALHGPEGSLAKEGQYDLMLISKATAPKGSDLADSNLCPGQ